MAFKYETAMFVYENINILMQIKMNASINILGNRKIVGAIYENNLEYFYTSDIKSDDNTNIEQYINSLPIVEPTYSECIDINNMCFSRLTGSMDFYFFRKEINDYIQNYNNTVSTTTSTTTTVTSTTITTTPCPSGVLSQKYYIDATNQCAICVPLNEFVCSPSQNYNYQNCLNSINSYNYGNPNCTTTQSPITSTTVLPTTTEVSTSEMPIGPQG